MELSELIQNTNGLRKAKREQNIKRIANGFYSFVKSANYTRFSKGLFLSFIPTDFNKRTTERLTKEVFKVLTDNEKIRPITENKIYIGLRNKPLFCWDFGSYFKLMKSNGYKVVYYKYAFDENRKIPIKKKVGETDINGSVNFDFDISEKISNKPREYQKVLSNSKLSIMRETIKRKVVLYQVI